MRILGSSSYTKNLYGQDNFSVLLHYSNINDGSISFLGDSNNISFLFNSGRLYDPNNSLLYVYTADSVLDIEITYSDNLYSIWCNNTILAASQVSPIVNNYITGLLLSNSSEDVVDIDVEIYGQKPSLTFSSIESSDSENYFGSIISEGSNINLISAFAKHASFEDITTYPNNTISYRLYDTDLVSGDIEDITFNFDFGSLETGLPVYIENTDIPTGIFKVFLSETFSEDVFIEDSYKRVQYNNFSIIYNITEEKEVSLELTYVDREGFSLVTGTGNAYGLHSGFVNGSGYIYCNEATGIIHPYLVTGTGITAQFVYTTGEIIYDYLIDVVGYEGGNLSTGVLFGEITGHVFDGSGYFVFDTDIVGTPSISVWHGGVNSSPVGSYTGHIYNVVILNKYIQSNHYVDFTGVGMIRTSTGDLSIFDMGTGDYTDVLQSNYESGLSFITSIKEGLVIEKVDTIYPDVGYIGGRVSYVPDTSNITDYARLDIGVGDKDYSFDLVYTT